MSSSNSDNDLMARLNALKKSSVSFSSFKQPTNDKGKDDLAARFLAFSTSRQTSNDQSAKAHPSEEGVMTSTDEDDKTIEELLAEIGPEDQWTLNPDEPKDIKRLMDEAKSSLTADQDKDKGQRVSDDDTDIDTTSKVAHDLSEETQKDAEHSLIAARDLVASGSQKIEDEQDGDHQRTEEDDAAATLQQILDELSLETALVDKDLVDTQNESPTTPMKRPVPQDDPSGSPVLDLPSTPDTAPTSRAPAESSEFGLPSVPTTKPGKKTTKSNLPTYTNEEIETWCVICNDDATIRCNGCDGDLYCAKCWREGHTGPDAGFEEKTHRWTKYLQPK